MRKTWKTYYSENDFKARGIPLRHLYWSYRKIYPCKLFQMELISSEETFSFKYRMRAKVCSWVVSIQNRLQKWARASEITEWLGLLPSIRIFINDTIFIPIYNLRRLWYFWSNSNISSINLTWMKCWNTRPNS